MSQETPQEEGLVECPKCKRYCDPVYCWCGNELSWHGWDHNFVPCGCICGFIKKD